MNPFMAYTLPTDQLFNLEFQFEFILNLVFQPMFGIQLRISIPVRIDLGECRIRIQLPSETYGPQPNQDPWVHIVNVRILPIFRP